MTVYRLVIAYLLIATLLAMFFRANSSMARERGGMLALTALLWFITIPMLIYYIIKIARTEEKRHDRDQ